MCRKFIVGGQGAKIEKKAKNIIIIMFFVFFSVPTMFAITMN